MKIEEKIRKRCLNCKYVWLNEIDVPVSCDYGLPKDSGASAIGAYCHKDGRKLNYLRKK